MKTASILGLATPVLATALTLVNYYYRLPQPPSLPTLPGSQAGSAVTPQLQVPTSEKVQTVRVAANLPFLTVPPELLSDSDPRVTLVCLSQQKIATSEEELSVMLARLSRMLAAMQQDRSWEAHDQAMEQFLKIVGVLREMGREVLANNEAFQKALTSFRKELDRAPEVYRQAVLYLRERATAKDVDRFHDKYPGMIEILETHRRLIQQRRAELQAFEREVADTIEFVKQSVEYLKDFETVVRLTPGIDTAAARRKFTQQLRGYAQAFEQFLKLFEEFSKKLKSAAFSENLSREHAAWQKAEALARSAFAEREKLRIELTAARPRVEAQVEAYRLAGRKREMDALLDSHNAKANTYRSHFSLWELTRDTGLRARLDTTLTLQEGQVYILLRRSGEYVGPVRVVTRTADGAYELEPLSGVFQRGDRLLIKV